MKHAKPQYVVGLIGLIGFLLCGCGGDEASPDSAATFLVVQFQSTPFARLSEVRVFPDSSLWEYINGDAEIYIQYDVREVATADYQSGDIEIVADVYRFAEATGAYGLYTSIRPPEESRSVALGIDGFASEATLNFVKGDYLVRLTGYSDGGNVPEGMDALAAALADIIPGATTRPATFDLFPEEHQLAGSDHVYGGSFLGQDVLSGSFAQGYQIGNDTLMLFVVEEDADGKFTAWRREETVAPNLLSAPAGLPLDLERAFLLPVSYYGPIVAGVVGTRLVGIVNFQEPQREFVSAWLSGLSP